MTVNSSKRPKMPWNQLLWFCMFGTSKDIQKNMGKTWKNSHVGSIKKCHCKDLSQIVRGWKLAKKGQKVPKKPKLYFYFRDLSPVSPVYLIITDLSSWYISKWVSRRMQYAQHQKFPRTCLYVLSTYLLVRIIRGVLEM